MERTIQLDPLPGGGYGTLYGPNVTANGEVTTSEGLIAGDEYIAFEKDDHGRNVTMMVQVPETFDPTNGCIVTAPSSGSRGVYGAIATAGEWGLKRGCAVAYTDKGTGTGAHNLQANTVNLIRGQRAADRRLSVGERTDHLHRRSGEHSELIAMRFLVEGDLARRDVTGHREDASEIDFDAVAFLELQELPPRRQWILLRGFKLEDRKAFGPARCGVRLCCDGLMSVLSSAASSSAARRSATAFSSSRYRAWASRSGCQRAAAFAQAGHGFSASGCSTAGYCQGGNRSSRCRIPCCSHHVSHARHSAKLE
jgi:hypothetical protein